MIFKDLLFYTRGWAKPIYHLKPNDKIQLLHGSGLVTKVNHSPKGLIKVFWKREGFEHGYTPCSKIFGVKACRTEFMLMIHD